MPVNENGLFEEAGVGTHDKVIALLQEEKRGKLLDTPAGEGAASKRLEEMGFEVFAADFNEEKFKLKDIPFQKVDLDENLPYKDRFFDYVVCIEGIEHIENPFHLIREFRRILNKGGKLIITTPNILNIYSRLRYLLLGYPDWHEEEAYYVTPANLYQLLRRHLNPVSSPKLQYILENNGFFLENIATNCTIFSGRRPLLRPFFTLLYLFTGSFILFATLLKRKKSSQILLSPKLLFGESLIVKARKE